MTEFVGLQNVHLMEIRSDNKFTQAIVFIEMEFKFNLVDEF